MSGLNGHRVKFAKEFTAVYLRKDYKGVFMDKVPYETETPTIPRGEDFLIGIGTIKKMHSPDIEIICGGDIVTVDFTVYTNQTPQEQIARQWYFVQGPEHHCELKLGSREAVVDGQKTELQTEPEAIDGVIYLPYISLMKAMGASVNSYRGKMTAVSFEEGFTFDNSSTRLFRYYNMVLRNKGYGDIYGCFWFEAGKRLIPYHLFIPTSYRPDKPHKAIFYFHGGGGNEDAMFERTMDYAQEAAQRRGFVLVGTNGFIRSSFYGSLVPIIQTLDSIAPDQVDYDNPEGWPEETVRLRRLSLECIHEEMKEIFKKVNLDKENLFATGNSAGSVACMHFALNEPQLFKGICPTGGFINYNFYDLEKFKALHEDDYMMHIVGTEDDHGFDFLLRGHEKLEELGIRYQKVIIGGGNHSNAWVKPGSIDVMMDFFDDKTRGK